METILVTDSKPQSRLIADNRKAFHDFFVLDRWEAGIVLRGTEIKAAREGKVQLRDAYAEIRNGEAFLVNAHINHYSHGNIFNHEPTATRKLLLHKEEIRKLIGKTREKGLTLIPLKMYLKGGLLKCELGLCRGKKSHDKRAAILERETERETRAAMHQRNLRTRFD